MLLTTILFFLLIPVTSGFLDAFGKFTNSVVGAPSCNPTIRLRWLEDFNPFVEYRLPNARMLKAANSDTSTVPTTNDGKPCFWKPKGDRSRWKERIHIRDLKIGQKLTGHVVEEYLDGRTGPKLFFECGVGRTNTAGEWRMVNGMMRLDRSKKSVAQKRVARLRKKDEVDLYVSRIQLGCGRLEVCLEPEDVVKYQLPPKTPVSTLRSGQEVTGKVVRLLPYGALVDVGANRVGLLHIQKVADLYGRYIDKEEGLVKAGLERGAKIRVAVAQNVKRRLSLDFTEDVKEEAAKDQNSGAPSPSSTAQNNVSMSEEELAAWAAYASDSQGQSDDDDYEDEDDYDEDKNIEDALGLGTY